MNRCTVLGMQLAKELICVDTMRLPVLAMPPLHSKTSSSSAALSSSKVRSRHLLNVTQGPIAQQQFAPAFHIRQNKAGPGQRHSACPAFPTGSGIHKVVKSLITRLSGAQRQSCESLTVSTLIALRFVCYGSSMLAMSQF